VSSSRDKRLDRDWPRSHRVAAPRPGPEVNEREVIGVGVRRTGCTDEDLKWMRRAVELGRQSIPELGRSDAPKVGVVIVREGKLVGESWRGAAGSGLHAEYGLLESLEDIDLSGTTVYTTLEPCSRRNRPKRPCAERLIERKVATVVIGMYDPNPRIYREGWRTLRDAGVELRDFASDLRNEILADNEHFIDQYRKGIGPEGTAAFDYMQNDGRFEIRSEGSGDASFVTQWSMKGRRSIHAYDGTNKVAHARYATSFDEVDDPGALDFSSNSRPINEGGIAVFRNSAGYALVRVDKVLSGPRYGDDRTEVRIAYQLRLRS